jgi:hypothetical protein
VVRDEVEPSEEELEVVPESVPDGEDADPPVKPPVDEEPPVDDADTRWDSAVIKPATAMNSVTANVTVQRRIVRTRRRRAASRSATRAAASSRPGLMMLQSIAFVCTRAVRAR